MTRKTLLLTGLALGIGVFIIGAGLGSAEQPEIRPNGRGIGTRANPPQSGGGGVKSNGITYHGGPVITAGTKIYYIWYGTWSGNQATAILDTLANSIGGSPYFNINTTYADGGGHKVLNSPALFQETYVSAPGPGTLSDADIQSIVATTISKKLLPSDANGVYFVLTSADFNESSGFCTNYCGWHTHFTMGGTDIKYAFVGDSSRCPNACQAQAVGPNGSSGGDGMASIVAHELEEATTDPDLNAWYDQRGYENADKCAWTFGTTYPAANGAVANMVLGGSNFLIQRNWVNAGGGSCALSY
jgi:hypothetical protein